jgi:hypothetical protein
MLSTFLDLLPERGTVLLALLAVVGVIVTLLPPKRKVVRIIWAILIVAIGVTSLYYTKEAQQKAQKEMYEKLIGGDDYCYLFVKNPQGRPEVPVFMMHPGHHPLHDVSVAVTIVPRPDASDDERFRAVLNPVWTHFFPVLYPRVFPLGFTLPPGSYGVDIDAVNGGVIEMIEVKEVNGKAEPSFQVFRPNGERLVSGP